MSKTPILMYHSISDCTNPKFVQFTVSPRRFAEQMAYLRDHAYTPLTVTQWIDALNGTAPLPAKPIVLTFDDGLADFFTEALPILTRYSFPATLYIATAFVNGTCGWLRREEESQRAMLTWGQIAQLYACGIECGAHSHTHPQLDMLSPTLACEELVTSKDRIEQQLGSAVTSFAYPYGYYTATTQRLARAAGYTSACAVKHTLSSATTHPFALARLMVHAGTDRTAFAAMLTGQSSYQFATAYMRVRTPVWGLVRRWRRAVLA